MNSRGVAIFALLAAWAVKAASPGNAPPLPLAGVRIVNVSTEPQLQTAMGNLQSGDTILLADGTYNLTSSLYVNGRNNVTIRGNAGSTNVVLVGRGMDNTNYGNVPFGIWSNGTNTTIAHLTIRDTWDNEIIFNSGAQSPLVYCVRLLNAGSQFIKSNPTDVNAGIGVNNGIVEYCWFEYTGSPPGDHGSGVGYFNGISAHAAQNWIIRGNLFKNLHNPDTAVPVEPFGAVLESFSKHADRAKCLPQRRPGGSLWFAKYDAIFRPCRRRDSQQLRLSCPGPDERQPHRQFGRLAHRLELARNTNRSQQRVAQQ